MVAHRVWGQREPSWAQPLWAPWSCEAAPTQPQEGDVHTTHSVHGEAFC